MRSGRWFVLLVLFVFLASSAQAVTYVVPSDAAMIQQSDDIVIATGVTSLVERTERGGIVTRYTLRIEEVLKGQRSAGQHLVLTEVGGALADRIQYIPGAPEYRPGERYLVFTYANSDLEAETFGMGLGQFRILEQQGRSLALRAGIEGFNANLDPHVERARDVRGFIEYIRGIVSQSVDPTPGYFVDAVNARWSPEGNWKIESQFTRTSYLMEVGGQGFRWSSPTASFVTSGATGGPNGGAAVALAMSQWNGTASNINYSQGAQDDTAVGGTVTPDGKNAIKFNGSSELSPGVAGRGGITAGASQYSFGGEQFWGMAEVDVAMRDGATPQNCYNSVMVHEVGHTLGFRHSNQPPSPGGDVTSDAIMNSSVNCSWNGVLKTYDNNAAATVYGAGPVCNAPTIGTQPLSKTIAFNANTSLTVIAGGSSPFTYQWFIGAAPDATQPIPNSNGATLNIAGLTTTMSFWVRVSHSCSGATVNSATATVTVQACVPPSIVTPPVNRNIISGTSTALSVTAAGSGPFTYQWFIGASGDTSQPTGSNSSSLNVSPTTTTQYWVRVSGQCAPPIDSSTATVTVTPCPEVTVTASASAVVGGQSNLSANGQSTGQTVSYRWFRGTTPGTGGTSISTQQNVTVAVTTSTSYWVRATNGCNGIAFSNLVTVAPCTLPSIATQPLGATITTGGTATLSLVLGAGSGITTRWYRGTVGDKANQIGTGISVTTSPLTETTLFWASVTNSCGEIASNQVTVTVNAPVCTGPAITTQPISQQVKGGDDLVLTVGATGTETLLYQWFEGAATVTTKPVGTSSPTLIVPFLIKSSSYWVRVTNGCGQADSAVAQITVKASKRRSVRR